MFVPRDYNAGRKRKFIVLYAVYGQEHNALGKSIMDMVSTLKWGQPKSYTFWLIEGLATLFAPETLDCDGHTFEERYVYFLQSGISHFDEIYRISFDELIQTINDELNKKYPDPIDFNWDIFKEKCMK